MTEQEQLDMVTKNGLSIEKIAHTASPAVRLAAIKQNGASIQFLPNQTEEEKIEAVKRNPGSLIFIRPPYPKIINDIITPDQVRDIQLEPHKKELSQKLTKHIK